MVHAAVGFARMRNRLSRRWPAPRRSGRARRTCSPAPRWRRSNRIPVLLLPRDVFATRVRQPGAAGAGGPARLRRGVNDAFRPLSRFFDRVWRPEQLPAALLAAMRVLTDPAETGAVTIALPQDVQAEAHDWPEELFAKRVWHIARPAAEPAAVERAVEVIRAARRPLLIAGGGVHLRRGDRRAATGSPGPPASRSPTPRPARARCAGTTRSAVGGVGSTGTPVANALAREADVVIGIGTRYSDFTTASRTAFQHPGVRFVNLNVAALRRGQARRRDAGGRCPCRAGGADRGRSPATGSRSVHRAARRRRRLERGRGRTRTTSVTGRCRRRPRSSVR